MACSLAPAQIIISKNSQKTVFPHIDRMGVRSCSATGGTIGTLAYKKALARGNTAHARGR